MNDLINEAGLDIMFRRARTHQRWLDKAIPPETMRAIYDLARLPPTAANTHPGRFMFLRSAAAKERLRPHLDPGNVEQTMSAPCCVILALDTRFQDSMDKLMPGKGLKKLFDERPDLAEETAFRNATLQGAYFILAARALGLDCGPMSGFNHAGVDAEFLNAIGWRANFLCNIGYGDGPRTATRAPRLEFDEACRIV